MAYEEQLAAAEMYGRQRDQAELHAERAVQIALYYKLAEYELDWGGGPVPPIVMTDVGIDDALKIWIGAIALAAWNSVTRTTPEKGRLIPKSLDAYRVKKSWVDMVVAEKVGFIDKLAAARVERHVNQFTLPPEKRPSLGSHDAWAKSVARTEATRVASEALTEMQVLAMGEELGRPLTAADEDLLWKVWISRGDANVRELHRKLHGAPIRGAEKPFWTWPTGQQLRWPGDPLAPYGTIVNCRCIHWLMPAATQPSALEQTFKPADLGTAFDTPLAATAHTHHPSQHGITIGDATPEYEIVMSRIRGTILEVIQ